MVQGRLHLLVRHALDRYTDMGHSHPPVVLVVEVLAVCFGAHLQMSLEVIDVAVVEAPLSASEEDQLGGLEVVQPW